MFRWPLLALFSIALPAQDALPNDDICERLTTLVARAEALLQAGDHEAARDSAKEGLALMRQMAATIDSEKGRGVVWRLGQVARRAGSPRIAHDVWHAVAEVRARTLADDDPRLLAPQQNLAIAKLELGDLENARTMLARLVEIRSRTQPDDNPDLQRARHGLGSAEYALGNAAAAGELFTKVLEVYSRIKPDDDPELLRVRENLAATRSALGDLRGAHAMSERILAIHARKLADDDPLVLSARHNLASVKRALGELAAAERLFEQVVDARSRTLPDDHIELQRSRLGLAGTRYARGDLGGAHALYRHVMAVWAKTLPDHHPDYLAVLQGLASTEHSLGNFATARALQEQVVDIRSRTLPDDHPDLLAARHNLALTLRDLGSHAMARALQEQVLAARARTLPADHPDVLLARESLAATLCVLGDPAAAATLQEQVLEVYSRTLPEDHPGLQQARQNLAISKSQLGEAQAAVALFEQALAATSRSLPDGHPDVQRARGNLALTRQRLGDTAGALDLYRECTRATRQSLQSLALAPRAAGALARAEAHWVQLMVALHDRCEPTMQRQLAADALLTAECVRGAELRTARLRRVARGRDPSRVADLEEQLRAAIADVGRKVDGRAGKAEIAGAVRQKEEIERQMADLALGLPRVAPTIAGLAARLPEHTVAVTIVEAAHHRADAAQAAPTAQLQLVALVLDRRGNVTCCALGGEPEVAGLVERIRSMAMWRQTGASFDDALRGLRRTVFDPVLAALPESTDTIVLSLVDLLQLVPLDALPLDSGELLGDRYTIQHVTSLLDLLDDHSGPAAEPVLFALGGVDYDKAAAAAADPLGDAALPLLDDLRSGAPAGFGALPGSADEVRAIAATFEHALDRGDVRLLLGRDASKRALTDTAARATFVHLATHGYFAPESVAAQRGADLQPLARFQFGIDDRVSALSPLWLTGIALAGANRPPDALGRRDGIATAEELASLDLAHCHLATLSACDTALGVRRAGQGFASLSAALRSAGARFVLASLWKVKDQVATDLMTDFYTRLWKQHQAPHAALWQAKLARRARGAPFTDWAGWVLSGR